MFVAPDHICQPMRRSGTTRFVATKLVVPQVPQGLLRQSLWDLWYYCTTGKGTLCHVERGLSQCSPLVPQALLYQVPQCLSNLPITYNFAFWLHYN